MKKLLGHSLTSLAPHNLCLNTQQMSHTVHVPLTQSVSAQPVSRTEQVSLHSPCLHIASVSAQPVSAHSKCPPHNPCQRTVGVSAQPVSAHGKCLHTAHVSAQQRFCTACVLHTASVSHIKCLHTAHVPHTAHVCTQPVSPLH